MITEISGTILEGASWEGIAPAYLNAEGALRESDGLASRKGQCGSTLPYYMEGGLRAGWSCELPTGHEGDHTTRSYADFVPADQHSRSPRVVWSKATS